MSIERKYPYETYASKQNNDNTLIFSGSDWTKIRGQNTHNEEHKGTRGPGEGHEITITAKEQATQNCEDHSRRKK